MQLERSYSADPEVVVRHARWTIEGLRREGILVAIKNFPWHGSSRDDSHRGLSDETGTWNRRELVSFERLVKEGLADCVTTAYIFNANWNRPHPATLPEKTTTGILREQLGFEGVVVSDDMGKGAVDRQAL